MGIPLYFKSLIQSYPNIKSNYNSGFNCERLFLDFNGIIHQSVYKVDSNLEDAYFENKLCECVFDELKNIIEFVNPSSLVYIGIDGIAPFAKIMQQRERRYKSSYLKNEVNKIKIKYNKSISKWDTNAISPGTNFMNNLERYLLERINSGIFNVNVILSGCKDVGEGEHKIIKYMNENPNNENNIIYGLDADLIMLSLINKNNIFLLRDTQTELDNDFFLIDIKLLKKCLITELKQDIKDTSLSNNEIINGYIFICFFLGNDFISTFPSLSIDENGINELILVYKNEIISKNRTFFDDNLKINNITLMKFLSLLMINEEKHILDIQKKYRFKEPFFRYNMSDYEIDVSKIEQQPLINKQMINYGKNWSKDHYLYYNNVTDKVDIDNISEYYVKTLQWLVYYYFDDCINYDWYYPYKSSPTISDFYNFIEKNKDISFSLESIPDAVDYKLQLMLIMPYSSINLLPDNIKTKIKTNKNYRLLYPNKYKFLTYKKRFLHEAILLLPRFNIDMIKQEIQF